jgi:hypothetical protein
LIENTSLRLLVRLVLSLEGWDVSEDEARDDTCAVVADLDCFVWPEERVAGPVRRATADGKPVLAITGQDLTLPQRTALGNPPVLAKPFELAAFVGVLQSWRPPAAATLTAGAA